MDLVELQEIVEKELAVRKPIRIRVSTAAGCLSSGAHDVQQRLEEALAERNAITAERDALVASASWRITAPLRWFTMWLRRSST